MATMHDKLMDRWLDAPNERAKQEAESALNRYLKQRHLEDVARAARRSKTRKGRAQ